MDTKPTDVVAIPVERGMVEAESEIGGILRLAVERNVSIDTIERLVALKERADERTAAAEFNHALAAFQAECSSIPKTSRAKITTKSGGQYEYSYAELDQIARTTRPLLTKHGLSYSWDSDLQGNKLVCTCTIRHVGGHAQAAKFCTVTDTISAMSDQQKVAAALTYARRQSLIQALGLTTTEKDTDGASEEKITEKQAHIINEWVESSGADLGRFLKYMNAHSVAEIHARDYDKAITALTKKKAGGGS
jgi:hypothetical protein